MIKNSINIFFVRIIFVLTILFISTAVYARSDSSVVVLSDSLTSVEWGDTDYRIPSDKVMERYREDSRFEYGDSFLGADLVEKISNTISLLLSVFLSSINTHEKGFSILLYILAGILVVGVIVLIILKIKGIKLKTIFGKKKLDTPEIDFYTEDVNAMDFNTLIESALKNNNYRLAIRFLYLRNLKKLSDNLIIKWNINKTNYSYKYEISDIELRSKFINTTHIFDYVWYGEFKVDENQYYLIENMMKDFNKMITNEK